MCIFNWLAVLRGNYSPQNTVWNINKKKTLWNVVVLLRSVCLFTLLSHKNGESLFIDFVHKNPWRLFSWRPCVFLCLSSLFSPEYCLQVFIFRLFAFQSGETQGKKSPLNMFLHSLLLLIRLIAVSVWVSISVLAYFSSRLHARKQHVETLYLRMSCLNSKTEEERTRILKCVCVGEGGGHDFPNPRGNYSIQ